METAQHAKGSEVVGVMMLRDITLGIGLVTCKFSRGEIINDPNQIRALKESFKVGQRPFKDATHDDVLRAATLR